MAANRGCAATIGVPAFAEGGVEGARRGGFTDAVGRGLIARAGQSVGEDGLRDEREMR